MKWQLSNEKRKNTKGGVPYEKCYPIIMVNMTFSSTFKSWIRHWYFVHNHCDKIAFKTKKYNLPHDFIMQFRPTALQNVSARINVKYKIVSMVP